MTLSLKEVIVNIEPESDMQLRTQSFIEAIAESKIVYYAVNQITKSSLCSQYIEKVPSSPSSLDSPGQEGQASKVPEKCLTLSSQGSFCPPPNQNFC